MYDAIFTNKKKLISIALCVLFMTTIGMCLMGKIHSYTSDKLNKLNSVHHVETGEEFKRYMKEKNSPFLAYGTLKTKEPLKSSFVKGKYLTIVTTQEHLTKNKNTDEDVKATQTASWEELSQKSKNVETVKFLGYKFDYSDIKDQLYLEDIDTVQQTKKSRVIYKGIRANTKGTMYISFDEDHLPNIKFYQGMTIDQTITSMSMDGMEYVFLTVWVIISVILVVFVNEACSINNIK